MVRCRKPPSPTAFTKEAPSHDSPDSVWNLGVHVRLDGPDFEAAFEIPVFTTAHCRDIPRSEVVDAAAERIGAGLPEGLAAVPRADGQQEFVLRPPWTLGQNLGCLIPAILLVAAAVWGLRHQAPLFLPLLAGGVSALAILTIVDGVFFPRRLVLGPGSLEIRGICLGTYIRKISLEGLTGVEVVPGMQTGSNEGQLFWAVQLLSTSGRDPVTVTSNLRRKADAQRLAEEIRTRLPHAPAMPASPGGG